MLSFLPTLRFLSVIRTVALSMGVSRQEYWSRLPFPSPGSEPESTCISSIGRQFFASRATGTALKHMHNNETRREVPGWKQGKYNTRKTGNLETRAQHMSSCSALVYLVFGRHPINICAACNSWARGSRRFNRNVCN